MSFDVFFITCEVLQLLPAPQHQAWYNKVRSVSHIIVFLNACCPDGRCLKGGFCSPRPPVGLGATLSRSPVHWKLMHNTAFWVSCGQDLSSDRHENRCVHNWMWKSHLCHPCSGCWTFCKHPKRQGWALTGPHCDDGVKVKRPESDAQELFADQNSGFGSCPSMLTISELVQISSAQLEHLGSDTFLVNFSCRCNKRDVKIRLTTEQNREAAHLKTSIN